MVIIEASVLMTQFAGYSTRFYTVEYLVGIDLEQAGCQKKRGCTEISLYDYAKKKWKKLYLLCVDFEKAFDKVP